MIKQNDKTSLNLYGKDKFYIKSVDSYALVLNDISNIDITKNITVNNGDITITSEHDEYIKGQKGITVNETGEINPCKNLYQEAA